MRKLRNNEGFGAAVALLCSLGGFHRSASEALPLAALVRVKGALCCGFKKFLFTELLSTTGEVTQVYENFTKTIGQMETFLNTTDTLLDTFQQQTQNFYQHFDKLQYCTTEDELDNCKMEFEKEFNVHVGGEQPMLYQVPRRLPSDDTSDVEMSDQPKEPVVLYSL